jgi:hypothetical protein
MTVELIKANIKMIKCMEKGLCSIQMKVPLQDIGKMGRKMVQDNWFHLKELKQKAYGMRTDVSSNTCDKKFGEKKKKDL